MAIANLSPHDRYAIVGKTGVGKTQEAIVLASFFAQGLPAPWEVWWIDTKGVEDDIKTLRSWGFCNGSSDKDMQRPGGLRNALYFMISGSTVDGVYYDTVTLAQAKMQEAYNRRNVIVVVDEYTQVCPSEQNPGYALRDIFTRGRGRNVGLIGLTQEPVRIPRMLLSQASHLALFSVTHTPDIKRLKELCPTYVPPIKQGDRYGFYWSHEDGSAQWAYYQNQKKWAEGLNFAMPTKPKEAAK
jgi:hypothetical protein